MPPQVNGFRSYVDLYVKDKLDETGVALKVVNEAVNERWEVCLTMSEKGFQQISFVNSIATTKVAGALGPSSMTLTLSYFTRRLPTRFLLLITYFLVIFIPLR